ncbi:MAG: PilZ domain-containing protein [Gemmataceae bacterium]|nr:PilZ domain-containing protein [Gemmataceae bacterium]
MPESSLASIAEAVTRRAERQGYVTPRDIRSELALAGLPETRWKDVLALVRDKLNYRQGRYYLTRTVSARLFQEQAQQRLIEKAIRKLVRQHRAAVKQRERRGQLRSDFIQPVKVTTDDGKVRNLVSRDLSTTGIRLLGTVHLLGQKVQVELPRGDKSPPVRFSARILWTCAVGDNLFENGGTFLSLEE